MMVSRKVFISVIIPTYNREKLVLRALNSVLSQRFSFDLKNKFKYEVIIVDDASTDNTEVVVKSFINKNKLNMFVSYYRLNQNSGPNVARQFGIDKANGNFILCLDSDDRLISSAFEIIYKSLILSDFRFGVYLYGVFLFDNGKRLDMLSEKGSHFFDSFRFNNKLVNLYVYDYYDILRGCIGGEFIGLIDKKFFNFVRLDDSRFFCFESFSGLRLKD